MNTTENHHPGGDRGRGPGRLFIVGLGPGGPLDRTRRAEKAIELSEVVAGYHPYVESIADLTAGKELIVSGMRQEVERCRAALRRAQAGATVALVSSGDPGVYGMAGLALEQAEAEGIEVSIEIVPGVSAAGAAAARLGAPLMLDYACVSLSDLLVPWERIRRRLELLAEADMVVALYNPRSTRRVRQLEEAVEIFLQSRPASTPVGIAKAIGSPEESIILTTLAYLLEHAVDMRTVVIVGNSDARIIDNCLGPWFVTSRGYSL